MKKQLLLFVCVFITILSFAQVRPLVGIRAGVTSSNISGDAVNNLKSIIDLSKGMITTNSRQGFYAGGYLVIAASDVILIEPAIYYSQKGYEMKGALDIKGMGLLGANAKSSLKIQYIDVPVVVKAKVGGLQIFAGPQFSYLLNANMKTTAGILGFNLLNNNIDATSQFNKTDFALTGGVEFELTPSIHVIASYDYGLSKLDANRNISSYNRSFKLGIGMRL